MNNKSTTYLSTALIVAGFLLIVFAWNGAASEFLVDKQIPYLVSGGLAGIGMIGCGCTLALAQEVRKAAARIEAATKDATGRAAAPADSDPLADTLPEPRSGSTIEREPETAGA